MQSCGDCHLNNFGAFASPEGTAVFDVNDFDETLPAPFEWDIKRLATSFALAARARGTAVKACRNLARTMVQAYRLHMNELARLDPLVAWRTRVDVEQVVAELADEKLRERDLSASSPPSPTPATAAIPSWSRSAAAPGASAPARR